MLTFRRSNFILSLVSELKGVYLRLKARSYRAASTLLKTTFRLSDHLPSCQRRFIIFRPLFGPNRKTPLLLHFSMLFGLGKDLSIPGHGRPPKVPHSWPLAFTPPVLLLTRDEEVKRYGYSNTYPLHRAKI